MYPFAFLATYAPGVTAAARIQYQPLSQALRELAGAKNKKALVHLLTPIHQASQQSGFVKELLDSGDLYQPLAWTPREAYCFLKEVPLFEESGHFGAAARLVEEAAAASRRDHHWRAQAGEVRCQRDARFPGPTGFG